MATSTKLNPYIVGEIAECTNIDALKALRAKDTLADYVGLIDSRIEALTPEGDAAAIDLDAILGGLPKAPTARKPKAGKGLRRPKAPKAVEVRVAKERPFKKRVYRFTAQFSENGGLYCPARGKDKKNSIVLFDNQFTRDLYEAIGQIIAKGVKHPNER